MLEVEALHESGMSCRGFKAPKDDFDPILERFEFMGDFSGALRIRGGEARIASGEPRLTHSGPGQV
jgi:hypothetical protein